MLINLRNALMTGKRLPYDAEVEFLESTGTQWIDTGINVSTVSNNLRVRGLVKFTNLSAGEHDVLGSGGLRTPTMGRNGAQYFMWAEISTSWYPASCDMNWHELDFSFSNPSGRTFSVDGSSYSTSSANKFFGTDLYLFTSGPGRFPVSCQIGRIQIFIDNTLVRDYIPVRVGTVGYLYDRVSGKLFGNAGTGDFTCGPDVVPVEWLEGGQLDSGIAFIDTGYAPNSSTKIESTAAIFSAWGYSGRFGNRSRLTVGIGNGSLYMAQGNHYYLGDFTAGTFYSFVNDIPNRTVSVEGVGSTSTTAVSDWYPQLYPIYLFVSNVSPNSGIVVNGKQLDTNSLGRIRMKSCSIWENDIPVRNYISVRVGTDATSWEGAMMDVLTRRIYRNQGTGAFGYGNDLPYPIPAS